MRTNGIFYRAGFAALLLLIGQAGLLPAQQPASGAPAAQTGAAQTHPATEPAPASTAPTISVDARLVNIPVVVRDKKGALVQNLTKDNFILQVDAHPQVIRYFNVDKDLPLTLGLLVDTSQSQREVLDDEARARCGKPLRHAEADTDVTMRAEVLTYSRARGLFAGVSLEGSTLRPDNDANENVYGSKIPAKEIVLHGAAPIPSSARLLIDTLNQHSPKNLSK